MNKINLFFAIFLLTFLTIGCEKNVEIPEPSTPVAVAAEDTRNIVQTQDAIAQLFSVTAYSRAFAELQQQGIPAPCGTPAFFEVENGNGFQIDFDNCTLGTDLIVDGFIRFETFGGDDPSNNDTNTDLYFTEFTINGCTIINLSPGSFIRFQDVAAPNAGYDLFEVFTPQTFRVNHNLDNNYTLYLPFNTIGIPQDEQVHLKIRTDPSLNINYTSSTPQAFLDSLYNVEFTLKIEERPNATGLSDDRWRAQTYTQAGVSVQNLQLLTDSDPNNTNLEDIEGLKMSLACGHFKGGRLILDKEIAGVGCYYPYQIFDFDYDMQSGDMHLDPIDCNYTLAAGDTESCDGWAVRTNYGECSSTICSVCSDLNQRPMPVCKKVQCW